MCLGLLFILVLVLHYMGILKIVHTEKTPITNFKNSSDFATKDGKMMLVLNEEILYKSDTISFWDTVMVAINRNKWSIISFFIGVGVCLVFINRESIKSFFTPKRRLATQPAPAGPEAAAESLLKSIASSLGATKVQQKL